MHCSSKGGHEVINTGDAISFQKLGNLFKLIRIGARKLDTKRWLVVKQLRRVHYQTN